MKGGLASGADLLKQEESQFVTAEQRANFVPDPKNLELLSKLPGRPSKSLMDIKKEMLQKANGQKDKPKLSFPNIQGRKDCSMFLRRLTQETYLKTLQKVCYKSYSGTWK